MISVNIICMKWGIKYGPEYVNILYSMVKRHLHRPFRFVCLTDDNRDINPAIECLPIPPLDIPNGPERGWDKLMTFSSPLYDLAGEALFLDLDVVIVDDIDCFFDDQWRNQDQLLIIKDWVKKNVTGNSSVYRFTLGQFPDVLDYFKREHVNIRKQFRNEQEYLSHYMSQHHKLAYWPYNWCKSFKYHCLAKGPVAWFTTPVQPTDCKIVVFHGNPNPPDAIIGRSGKWYRKFKPTPWVGTHWR